MLKRIGGSPGGPGTPAFLDVITGTLNAGARSGAAVSGVVDNRPVAVVRVADGILNGRLSSPNGR